MDIECKNACSDVRKAIVVTGPTATGKTGLAVKLARRFDCEIISIDSRQVYRKMDIGTGKDLEEYGDVPYHLIDIADPAAGDYNLWKFCHDAFSAVDDITHRGKTPLLCGGTALYLEALLRSFTLPGEQLPMREKGVPRTRREDSGAEGRFTPPFKLDALVLGVYYPRLEVRSRIEQRLDARFAAGMVDEIAQLNRDGVSFEQLEFYGLEYREISAYLQGKVSFEDMRTNLLNRIRQFAKRQDIFFRKLEREGIDIHWIERGDFTEACDLVSAYLDGREIPEPQFRLSEHKNAPSYLAEK